MITLYEYSFYKIPVLQIKLEQLTFDRNSDSLPYRPCKNHQSDGERSTKEVKNEDDFTGYFLLLFSLIDAKFSYTVY
jgi:hypothetical protein